MGGILEQNLGTFLRGLVSKIKWLPELQIEGERIIALSHFNWMLGTTALITASSCVAQQWFSWAHWLNLLAIFNYGQVVISEWPPNGRLVDWVSRSLGWIIGVIPAIIILIKNVR